MSSKPKYAFENLNISVLISLLSVHMLATFAPFFWSKAAILLCLGLTVFTAWVGIGVCFHRLLTHQSFKTPQWFRYVLSIIGVLNFQGGIFFWVGKHQIHHKYSDKEGDPHSPVLDGFTWAHVLWLIFRKEDGHDPYWFARYLMKDRGLVLIDRFAWVPQAVLTVILMTWGICRGGWHEAVAFVVWGIGVRTVIVYHMTWFVNSASHTWGYVNDEAKDHSRNLWWVALISGGEGWHANHHAQPASASHGMRWFEIDVNYWIIVMLSWFGLVYKESITKPVSWRKPTVV